MRYVREQLARIVRIFQSGLTPAVARSRVLEDNTFRFLEDGTARILED